jgi:hypothetical protein
MTPAGRHKTCPLCKSRFHFLVHAIAGHEFSGLAGSVEGREMETAAWSYSRSASYYHNQATARLDGCHGKMALSVAIRAAAAAFSTAAKIAMILKSRTETPAVGNISSSPVNQRCSICLAALEKRPFYPDQCCCQQYCLPCLLERSKFSPECPWCKEKFTLIVHPVSKVDHTRLLTCARWREVKEEVETVCRKASQGLANV